MMLSSESRYTGRREYGLWATMPMIEFHGGEILVEAAVIGEGLSLQPAAVQEEMRAGRITSLCERGSGEDEGRFRLTFFTENRRFRIIVDEAGADHPAPETRLWRPPASPLGAAVTDADVSGVVEGGQEVFA